jgi:transposase-like protein
MAKPPAKRSYTAVEKAAYVTEVERLYRAGGRTYASIAHQLGIAATSYHTWIAAGIKPNVAATSAKASKPRASYTPEERGRLVAEVERLHDTGRSLEAACQAVGIGDKTFRVWRAQQPRPLPMREVSITALVPAMPAIALAVVAPGGYRVEGLDVETAARLLRALA